MISVSEETRRAFMSDTSTKKLTVIFPELNLQYDNSYIETESLKLTEGLASKDSIEYVGGISSSLEIKIYGIEQNIKGKRIELYIQADDTDVVPLFKGIVDSAVINSTKYFKTINAYDVLYTIGQVDVVDWYNSFVVGVPRTIKEIRDSLFNKLGVRQVEQVLPNDDIIILKEAPQNTMQALSVIKSLCQANARCGIINREGLFEYRMIKPAFRGLFPSKRTFPSKHTFPSKPSKIHTFEFYESLKYEEYFVKAMERVQVRESEEDIGYIVGAEEGNKYIVQNNMFANGLDGDSKKAIAEGILKSVKRTEFFPFEAKNYGLPFIEVGDTVEYILAADRPGRYATNKFIVLQRTLTGVQLLNDTYSATGTEEQSEFITDLQAQLDSIKHTGVVLDNYYDKTAIDTIMDQFEENYMTADEVQDYTEDVLNELETPTGFNIVSCYTVPSSREPGTVYLIQGGVIME